MTKFILPVSAAAALALVSGCAQDQSSTYTPGSRGEEASVRAYEPPDTKPRDLSAMASKMEELGKVGAHHNIINSFVGTWECQVKTWCPMQTEPVESRGTMNVRQINDARFIQGDYKGTFAMPGPDGKTKETPFTGTKLWGYSNADSEYQCVWADNMSTSMVWMTGKADTDPSTVTLTGTCKGPDETGKIVKHTDWEKIKMVSSDKYVSEHWSEGPGEPKHKVMEITYTRLNGVGQP